jgi:hypothetical protein
MNKISITLSKKERGAFIVLILTGILALSYFKGLDLQKNIETERVMHDALFAKLNPFRSVVFEARSVYIMNLANSNELYTRHPDTVLPLASLARRLSFSAQDSSSLRLFLYVEYRAAPSTQVIRRLQSGFVDKLETSSSASNTIFPPQCMEQLKL